MSAPAAQIAVEPDAGSTARATWIAAGAFAVLTLFMTMPLPLRMVHYLPAGAVDLWQNYWNFWWWKKCLFGGHLQSPYTSHLIFYPTGADLSFYTHSPFNMLAAMPVNLALGPAAAYNFCVLLALWLSGFFMFLFAREATGSARGAFIAGIVYAFFPNHMEQTLEHLNLFSIQFIPLALYYFLRVNRYGRRTNIAMFGVAFAMNALCSWDLAILLTLALLPMAAVEVWRGHWPRRARLLGAWSLAAVVALLIILPFAWSLLGAMASGADYFQKSQQPRGIDALYLLLPSFNHPIWGGLTLGAYARRAYDAAGFTSFLGYVPLALAVFAVARRAKGAGLWAAYFLVALVLALGAHPWWNGRLIESVRLPFAVFEKLPLLSLVRIANRFMIFAGLALGMLAAVGLVALGGWLASRLGPNAGAPVGTASATPEERATFISQSGIAGFGLCAALILLEYAWLPYPMQKVPVYDFYEKLAREKGGAVLQLPFTGNGQTVENMRAQVAHGRPIAGGYSSTPPPLALKFIADDPVLSDLAGDSTMAQNKAPSIAPPLTHAIDRAHLAELGFQWVVLDKTRAQSRADSARAQMDRVEQERASAAAKGYGGTTLDKFGSAPTLFDRKLLSRLGGIPQAKFDRIRAELERALGPPEHESEDLVAFPVNP